MRAGANDAGASCTKVEKDDGGETAYCVNMTVGVKRLFHISVHEGSTNMLQFFPFTWTKSLFQLSYIPGTNTINYIHDVSV